MEVPAVLSRIVAAGPRQACSDGERRAASSARDELRGLGLDARLETIWLRPGWASSAALHMALAIAGSLISVWQADAGLAVLAVTAVSLAGELTGRLRIARLAWPLRATQNVVVEPADSGATTRLVVTANLDAGTNAAMSGDRWRELEVRLRRALRGILPAPLGVLWVVILLLTLLAGLRVDGQSGQALAIIQFALTVLIVIAFAVLIDIAIAEPSPGASVNASGVAVAIALTDELRRLQLAALDVELVLAGAGDRQGLGFERYVRSRRRHRLARDVVVLSIEPTGAGRPVWLEADGQLVPLRMHPRLCELMAAAAAAETHLGARPLRAHGISGAHVARRLGWPAIAVGALDTRRLVPHAHQPSDVPEALEPAALTATLELCLAFAGLLDAELQAVNATPPGRAASHVPGETGAARD
jgi:hypothetical protein